MTVLPNHGRRRLLGLMATLPVALRTGAVSAAPARAATLAPAVPAPPFPEAPTLLVAGPSNGALEGWADAVQPAIEQSLPPDTSIKRLTIGGPDGVTGANQFEARAIPDGLTVLLVPGQAAIAWLVGDPRAQFDAAQWVPVMAGVTPGLIVGRAAASTPGRPVRIAVAKLTGLELPALLGLDLLGNRAEPVEQIIEPAAARAAFISGAVDAVFLRGDTIPALLPSLAAAGAEPVFSLGVRDESGKLMRDPAYPDVPHLGELSAIRTGRQPSGPLYNAWCATAAAVQLEFGLMLPQLTPAAMVALWRRAAADAAITTGVQTKGISLAVRPLGGPAATASAAAVTTDSTAMLDLRRWLATRFNWHPRT
jgi:hypothetical protein